MIKGDAYVQGQLQRVATFTASRLSVKWYKNDKHAVFYR